MARKSKKRQRNESEIRSVSWGVVGDREFTMGNEAPLAD